jgi:hypothetical protein
MTNLAILRAWFRGTYPLSLEVIQHLYAYPKLAGLHNMPLRCYCLCSYYKVYQDRGRESKAKCGLKIQRHQMRRHHLQTGA